MQSAKVRPIRVLRVLAATIHQSNHVFCDLIQMKSALRKQELAWVVPRSSRSLAFQRADSEYGQFSKFQFARFQTEGLKSQNHCLFSLQDALGSSNLPGAGAIFPD